MSDTSTTWRPGATFGVGSLPHRNRRHALDFAWRTTDIPTIPTLPRRSPAEGMIAQALVGIEGVSVGQYGGISVDPSALDIHHFVTTDLHADAYATFAEFLATFSERNVHGVSTVKWQFVGPVTLGAALIRIGLDPEIAFPLALQAVRSHVLALEAEVAHACGDDITQIVVLDEPSLGEALTPGYVVGADTVIDFVSGALAAVEPKHRTGLHCCGLVDWGAMLATGARIISAPVPNASDADAMAEMLVAASRISDHLEHGGFIAWGAVRTDGPIAVNGDRGWKSLMETMCALVNAGVDPVMLRTHSFVTPACGLGTHTDAIADRVFANAREISARVGEQATASKLTLGS